MAADLIMYIASPARWVSSEAVAGIKAGPTMFEKATLRVVADSQALKALKVFHVMSLTIYMYVIV